MARGFSPTPPAPPSLTLAARDGQRLNTRATGKERDGADSIYERRRRMVQVANVSDTGFGIEGDGRDCGQIAVGDIVALRLEPGGPLEVCKVMRRIPARTPDNVWMGVRRLTARARTVSVGHVSPRDEGVQTLAFIPGEDASGRHDSWLVSERTFAEGVAHDASVGECTYSFRFNRARERGRGWVMAGFEIVGARVEAGRGAR
jgi:hypothetical protein